MVNSKVSLLGSVVGAAILLGLVIFMKTPGQLNEIETEQIGGQVGPESSNSILDSTQVSTSGPSTRQVSSARSASERELQETSIDTKGKLPETEAAEKSSTTFDGPGAVAAERDTPKLSQRVFAVIEEVQKRQLDGQWEEALNEMNALYTEFETLNSMEQATLLNFYTNALLRLEMWQESITAFSQMLTIQDLRVDVNARALMALGQLHSRIDENQPALSYFNQWLEYTSGMDNMDEQKARVRTLIDGIEDNLSSSTPR